MRVVVRAFTKDGYHRDILVINERQVVMNETRVREPTGSLTTGLIGHGGQIDPKDFPEVTHFEIVVKVGR